MTVSPMSMIPLGPLLPISMPSGSPMSTIKLDFSKSPLFSTGNSITLRSNIKPKSTLDSFLYNLDKNENVSLPKLPSNTPNSYLGKPLEKLVSFKGTCSPLESYIPPGFLDSSYKPFESSPAPRSFMNRKSLDLIGILEDIKLPPVKRVNFENYSSPIINLESKGSPSLESYLKPELWNFCDKFTPPSPSPKSLMPLKSSYLENILNKTPTFLTPSSTPGSRIFNNDYDYEEDDSPITPSWSLPKLLPQEDLSDLGHNLLPKLNPNLFPLGLPKRNTSEFSSFKRNRDDGEEDNESGFDPNLYSKMFSPKLDKLNKLLAELKPLSRNRYDDEEDNSHPFLKQPLLNLPKTDLSKFGFPKKESKYDYYDDDDDYDFSDNPLSKLNPDLFPLGLPKRNTSEFSSFKGYREDLNLNLEMPSLSLDKLNKLSAELNPLSRKRYDDEDDYDSEEGEIKFDISNFGKKNYNLLSNTSLFKKENLLPKVDILKNKFNVPPELFNKIHLSSNEDDHNGLGAGYYPLSKKIELSPLPPINPSFKTDYEKIMENNFLPHEFAHIKAVEKLGIPEDYNKSGIGSTPAHWVDEHLADSIAEDNSDSYDFGQMDILDEQYGNPLINDPLKTLIQRDNPLGKIDGIGELAYWKASARKSNLPEIEEKIDHNLYESIINKTHDFKTADSFISGLNEMTEDLREVGDNYQNLTKPTFIDKLKRVQDIGFKLYKKISGLKGDKE